MPPYGKFNKNFHLLRGRQVFGGLTYNVTFYYAIENPRKPSVIFKSIANYPTLVPFFKSKKV